MFSASEADLNLVSPKQARKNLWVLQCDLVCLSALWEQMVLTTGKIRGRVKPSQMTPKFLQKGLSKNNFCGLRRLNLLLDKEVGHSRL